MKLNDIPLSKAYTIWAKSFMFDNMVLEVMNYIVQKEQPRLLINRNPTLNFYSMLLMKIRCVKHSVDDFTLSVPLSILPGLNADQHKGLGLIVILDWESRERLTGGVSYL